MAHVSWQQCWMSHVRGPPTLADLRRMVQMLVPFLSSNIVGRSVPVVRILVQVRSTV